VTEWWGAGVVICLERGADLHMVQPMPLPLTVSCKIQIGFYFLVPAHPGSPGQRAVKRVCVCVCVEICTIHYSSEISCFVTTDMMGRGGTFVNRRRLSIRHRQVVLADGDILKFAESSLFEVCLTDTQVNAVTLNETNGVPYGRGFINKRGNTD